MIFGVTERASARRCLQQWDYTSFNRQALQSLNHSQALQTGTLVHRTLAEWTLEPTGDPMDMLMKHSAEMFEQMKAEYLLAVGAAISDKELDSTYKAVVVARRVISNYQAHWQTPIPNGYRVVQPEQSIVVPIPGTEHELAATLDTLIERMSDGLLFIVEHKTFGRQPDQMTLDTNYQFLEYLWVLMQLKLGEVGGIAYDGMWTTETRKPLPELFIRKLLIRNAAEFARFEHDLAAEANYLASNPPIILNRRWEGCFDCSMLRLCYAETRNENAEFVRRTQYGPRAKDILHANTPVAEEIAS